MEISHGLLARKGAPTQAGESLFTGGGPAVIIARSVAAFRTERRVRRVRFFPVGDRPAKGPGSGNYSRVVEGSEHFTTGLRDSGRRALPRRCPMVWAGRIDAQGQTCWGKFQGHLTGTGSTARNSKPGVRSPGCGVWSGPFLPVTSLGQSTLRSENLMPVLLERSNDPVARSMGRNVSPALNVRPGSDTRLDLPSSLEA